MSRPGFLPLHLAAVAALLLTLGTSGTVAQERVGVSSAVNPEVTGTTSSGISAISPVLLDPSGSRNVRMVMPIGPKSSSRLGELSQCSTSLTSWVIT